MEKELEVAKYILKRHKDELEREEIRSLSKLRQMVSPYSGYVTSLKTKILGEVAEYDSADRFRGSLREVLSHASGIELVDLPIQYSLTFEEIEELKAASRLDKALLITSLLRAIGSEDAAVVFGKNYVAIQFSDKGIFQAIDIENNILLKEEAEGFIQGSKPKYIFNDLFFEFGK